MQPWKISVGLGISIAALAIAGLAKHFHYLGPYSRLIVAEYWWPITLHFLVGLGLLMSLMAGLLRSLGLVDVGRKVELMERSIERGDGDPELARRLLEAADGTYSE